MRRLSSSVTRADAQLTPAVSVEDPVDPLGQAAQVGQHRQQLVAHELLADRRPALPSAPSSICSADVISDRPGRSTRSVPSSGDERPRQQHDVGRQAHAEVGQHDDELLHHVGSTVPPGRTCSAISRASARSSSSADVVSVDVGHPLDAVAQQADVAAGEGDEDVDDRRLLDRVEPADGAEVDQPERAVGEHEHVAGMRIGVEEAEAHHLVEHRPQQLVGERRRGRRRRRRGGDVGHRAPLEALLHEDPPGAQVAVQRRRPAPTRRRRGGPPSRSSRRPRGGSRARPAGPRRTGRACRRSARPDRTACAAGRGRRAGRARRGRAPSSPRCRAAGP